MNSKILFSGLLIFIFSASNFLFGQCGTLNTVLIEDQSQIDNFSTNYPDCTEINGRLNIEEAVPGGITNLNGLSQITKAENLWIYNNSALTNLNGLNNITALSDGVSHGRLRLLNNTSLENLDALENLQEILQEIKIVGNTSLTSIEGLHNVSITDPDLNIIIDENPSLTSLLGLTNLTIVNNLRITHNDVISNLNGLNNLTEVGRLSIIANQNLINLEGLNNLVTIEGETEIYSNPSLESFDGFESLTSSSGNFYLSNNTAVTNITGFSSLTTCSGFFGISNSPLLTSLNGLESLTNVNELYIEVNDMLDDISALSNVNINSLYQLYIHGSPLLEVCNYPNICQYLDIPSNNATIYNNAPGCSSRTEILQACGLIGIDENISSENFSIHPNPTNGTFTISGIEEGTVQITDSRGRILKTCTLGKDETSLNGLAEGIYFVNISNEKGSVTKQLVKN